MSSDEVRTAGPLERLVSGHSLDDLLWAYWDTAYFAGQANRTTDDEAGTAQEILYAIQLKVREMVAAEREACAEVCDQFDSCDPQHIAAAIRARGEQ